MPYPNIKKRLKNWRSMIRPNKEQVITYHADLIRRTGGSGGLRDSGMLESALESAFQTIGGEDLYPSVTAKITRIAYGLIRNHPFVDGNKRIGMATMVAFLKANNIDVNFTDSEIVAIGLEIANGSMNDHQLNDLITSRV